MANKFKKSFRDKIAAIEKAEAEVKKERKKIVVQCSHQNSKGKMKIYHIGNSNFKCKYCGEVFSMKPVSMGELKSAVETLHNVIQQMRAFSDPESDMRFIEHLGEMDFNIEELPAVYDRINSLMSKKKKNKNNNDEIGFSGMRGISFLDSRK